MGYRAEIVYLAALEIIGIYYDSQAAFRIALEFFGKPVGQMVQCAQSFRVSGDEQASIPWRDREPQRLAVLVIRNRSISPESGALEEKGYLLLYGFAVHIRLFYCELLRCTNAHLAASV